MNTYYGLDDLKVDLEAGTFPLGDEVSVDGIVYRQLISSKYHLVEILGGKAAIVVYSYTKDEENVKAFREQTELKEWITLVWKATNHLEILPHNVATTTRARVHANLQDNVAEADATLNNANNANGNTNDNVIGDTIKLRVTNLPGGKAIRGKVDTGATLCSLHADNIQVDRNSGRVSFRCEPLSSNTITATVVDHQAIKTADGGVEQRPVIQLNVEVNGKHYDGILFNLNDRSKMNAPLLVGQNFLEKGKFLIDPTMREEEEVDWDALVEMLTEQGVFEEKTPNPVDDIVNLMHKYGISLDEIVKHDHKKALES